MAVDNRRMDGHLLHRYVGTGRWKNMFRTLERKPWAHANDGAPVCFGHPLHANQMLVKRGSFKLPLQQRYTVLRGDY